ncbi:putative tRNA(adenine(34)) deaminase [Helianthus annuus]|nr:tRNA(adenine(34)) deaminase, chloroplastic-like [Helianthus annuus]KAF5819691.1 putative tRNA(adenine(34)) deaminase [Helianthus annuus]KAJ0806389.1 putative tRNA(adenine(34)) deaminase [Helianthus annuus]
MCAGAILQARIDTIVWGAPNKLLGADGSWIRLFPDVGGSGSGLDKPPAPVHPFHPNMIIRRGVLSSECADVMQQFFQLRRKKKDKKPEAESPSPPQPQPSCLPIPHHHNSKLVTKLHDVFGMMFCL